MAQKTYIEQTLETLVELVDLQRKSSERNFDAVNKTISELAVNVGQLTVQQKTIANHLDALTQEVRDTNAAIRETNSAIREMSAAMNAANRETNAAINGHLAVAQAQAANIAELTKLATAIISKS